MNKKGNNYSRFFALIKPLPGDHEEMKENLVRAFTNGRTISLREMGADEYRRMCDSLENSRVSSLSQKDFTAEIKRKRSAVLKRIQKLGIDTLDWAAVDEFCLNPRIAGKRFGQISLDELKRLIPKLEAIALKPRSGVAP
ncbi:MAG: hypothetical protein LBU80_01065, partial [Rikenellaceae bacterium]|nr:hypothetical protein [Rikenellaceae bacterium]